MREFEYLLGINLGAEAKLAIVDGKGQYKKWSRDWRGMDQRCVVTATGNTISVRANYDSSCRETLCNSWSTFFSYTTLPVGYQVTDKLPNGEHGSSVLSFTLSNSDLLDEYYYWKDKRPTKMMQRLSGLIQNDTSQRELVLLMDVLLGTVAMLIAGPTGFTRRKDNPLQKPSSRVAAVTTASSRQLKYDGVSNFWVHHPAFLSLMLGLGRTCIDFYVEGKFNRIDKKVGLRAQHKRLVAISKKKRLSDADKIVLRVILSKFKNYFDTKKIRQFPGHYPINPFTWTMFTNRLLTMDLNRKRIKDNWSSVGPYGITNGGFYQWCKDQSNQTSTFKRRKQRLNWD